MPEGTTDARIERAFDQGQILRTHVMRPTWHFVAPADIRWMLELTAPRVHSRMAPYQRHLGLDRVTHVRAAAIFERALGDGRHLTRAELGTHLARRGIVTDGIRLAHLAMYAELEGVICSGPRRGREFTYALLAERAPEAQRLSRDEALAEITLRYFRAHGPATVRDFVWWSGLTTADAKRGLEMNRARREVVEGRTYWTIGRSPVAAPRQSGVHLLPIYDEYLVAYRDRDAVPHAASTIETRPRVFVTFQHALLIDGQVAGTWKIVRRAGDLLVDVIPRRRLTAPERRAVADVSQRCGRFLDPSAQIFE